MAIVPGSSTPHQTNITTTPPPTNITTRISGIKIYVDHILNPFYIKALILSHSSGNFDSFIKRFAFNFNWTSHNRCSVLEIFHQCTTMHACIHMDVHTNIQICMHLCLRSCVRKCMHACVRACVRACTHPRQGKARQGKVRHGHFLVNWDLCSMRLSDHQVPPPPHMSVMYCCSIVLTNWLAPLSPLFSTPHIRTITDY